MDLQPARQTMPNKISKTTQPKTKETTQADQKKSSKSKWKKCKKKLDAQKIDDQKVVATVNKDKITGSEYNSALSTIQGQLQQSGQDPTSKEGEKAVKKQTIDALVGQELILQDAEKKGFKASDKRGR
ncbi:hypothetical protein BsIDN1_03530 [Bacillus safensis]|uniref:Peptidylprolyl isomerase n=1 Tax=Bacillus safensis TaxID=561879 RepID=A0A5S9M1U8_BACIA|nr:hypothetical protein BsIDN1_03530 [Bacillus safensis]